jgi:hypothetical protein
MRGGMVFIQAIKVSLMREMGRIHSLYSLSYNSCNFSPRLYIYSIIPIVSIIKCSHSTESPILFILIKCTMCSMPILTTLALSLGRVVSLIWSAPRPTALTSTCIYIERNLLPIPIRPFHQEITASPFYSSFMFCL